MEPAAGDGLILGYFREFFHPFALASPIRGASDSQNSSNASNCCSSGLFRRTSGTKNDL